MSYSKHSRLLGFSRESDWILHGNMTHLSRAWKSFRNCKEIASIFVVLRMYKLVMGWQMPGIVNKAAGDSSIWRHSQWRAVNTWQPAIFNSTPQGSLYHCIPNIAPLHVATLVMLPQMRWQVFQQCWWLQIHSESFGFILRLPSAAASPAAALVADISGVNWLQFIVL